MQVAVRKTKKPRIPEKYIISIDKKIKITKEISE